MFWKNLGINLLFVINDGLSFIRNPMTSFKMAVILYSTENWD